MTGKSGGGIHTAPGAQAAHLTTAPPNAQPAAASAGAIGALPAGAGAVGTSKTDERERQREREGKKQVAAAARPQNTQVFSLLDLLVQKYLLYWYKSTSTDARKAPRRCNLQSMSTKKKNVPACLC